jgi:hypothetical protein
MATEADTCRKFVVPKLQAAGWDSELQLVAVRKHLPDILKVQPISDRGNVNEINPRCQDRKMLRQLQLIEKTTCLSNN